MKAIIKVANTAANPNQELFIERIYFSFVNYQIMFETTPHQTLAMVFDTIENATALTEYFRNTGSGLYEMKDIVIIPTPEEKDIEKRASARYPYADDIDADPNSWAAKKACIEMAKKQREIDTQQAIEVYKHELKEIVATINRFSKDNIGEVISIEGSVKDFEKALKGK